MKKIESFARRRLAQLESEVFVDLAEIESTTEPVADLAASTFESALEAAGWVCALDGPHEQVDRFLSVAARAGLRTGNDLTRSITVGFGISLSALKVDYAYVGSEFGAQTSQFSVSINW